MHRLGNRIIGLLAALVLTTTTLGACGSGQPNTTTNTRCKNNYHPNE